MNQNNLNPVQFFGYNGRLLRMDMTSGKISVQALNEKTGRKYIGGTSLGIRIVYDEVIKQ
jgi:aldehyde:ferredoxin oxidoreductase